MSRFLSVIVIALLPFSALAEDATEPPQAPIFEGLDELADSLRDLFNRFEQDVTPFMDQLGEQLRDLDRYHPPEVLPNGDIIIRRKRPDEAPAPDAPVAKIL